MPTQIEIPGYCSVKVQQESGILLGTLVELGITRNGATVSYEHFYYNVPSDEFGGDDGPPADVQWLGSIARIRCEFTKYNRSVLFGVLGLVHGSTFGAMASQSSLSSKYPGELLFTPMNYTRVLLDNQIGDRRNFPRCIIRAPNEQNYSTKYASPIVEFEAHVHAYSSSDFQLHNTFNGPTFPGTTEV